jgi:amino acid permease-like protein
LTRLSGGSGARSRRRIRPWVPLFGILSCLLLMVGLPLDTWLRLIVWLVVGLAIYFFYGRSHSALRHPRPGADPRPGRAGEARPS